MLRREFLAASFCAACPRILSAATSPLHKFPTEPHARLGIATYPFRAFIRGGQRSSDTAAAKAVMTLEQFAASVPRKLNVQCIEPWSPHFESTDPKYVMALSKSFEQAGLRVINIPVDLRVRLCDSDPQLQAAGLEQYHRWVDAAAILGSPSIRVHVPAQSDGRTDVQCAIDTLSSLCRYASTKNVVINLENDNPRTEDPFSLMDLIKAVNSPWLHTLPDFCNTMLISNDRNYNHKGLSAMFPYAYNVSHVKDSEVDAGKVYTVDVNEIFGIAKQWHYRGYFSMEWEGGGDPYKGTASLIRKSLQALTSG